MSAVIFHLITKKINLLPRIWFHKKINVNEKRNDYEKNENTEKIEAVTYRKIIQFLRESKDVQNIDLMNLAGFCRNCISKWYMASAEEEGVDINYEEAREAVYGMSYTEWKRKYQK